MAERIVIRNTQSPGDYVVLTAAIRDLHLAHPGRFEFQADTLQQQVFEASPYVVKRLSNPGRVVTAKYPLIHQSNQQKVHFLWGFIEYLNTQLSAKAVLTDFRPAIYLSDAEKKEPPGGLKRPYWIVVAGGKTDYSAKWWAYSWWQKVIDDMKKWVPLVQVGSGSHKHPRMNGVIDLVNKTSFRELMQLIYHSEGVLSIVTCMMHIAAGFNKPCVVVGGGREPWWWEGYTKDNRIVNMQRGKPGWQVPSPDNYVYHRFLHTMGKMDCCKQHGCWKNSVNPYPRSVCPHQIQQDGQWIPKCMQMITPEIVLQSVDSYYKEGILTRDPSARRVEPVVAAAAAPAEEQKSLGSPPLEAAKLVGPPPVSPPINRVVSLCLTGVKPYEADLSNLKNGDMVALFRHPVQMKETWQDELGRRMEPNKAYGLVYWQPVESPVAVKMQNAPWFHGLQLNPHPFDPTKRRIYYLHDVMIVPAEDVKEFAWDKTASDEDNEVAFGEALRQKGRLMVDIGNLLQIA